MVINTKWVESSWIAIIVFLIHRHHYHIYHTQGFLFRLFLYHHYYRCYQFVVLLSCKLLFTSIYWKSLSIDWTVRCGLNLSDNKGTPHWIASVLKETVLAWKITCHWDTGRKVPCCTLLMSWFACRTSIALVRYTFNMLQSIVLCYMILRARRRYISYR